MATLDLLEQLEPVRRKLDVDEYRRMGEVGILGPGDRVELIEGELILMASIGDFHAGSSNSFNRTLMRAVGDLAVVAVANPVRLDRFNEPEPDFALLRPRRDDYRLGKPIPDDVLLLIELADTSLRFDRLVKLKLYARRGIPEVWIVDLNRHVLTAHADPFEDEYRQETEHGRGDVLRPVMLREVAIGLDGLL